MTEAELIFEAVARLVEATGALRTASVRRDGGAKFFLEIAETYEKFGKLVRNTGRYEWLDDEDLLNGSECRFSVFKSMGIVSEFEKANGDLRSVCRAVSSCRAGSYGEFVIRLAAGGVDVDAASKRGRELR